jgi:peptidoglycan-associated lipoprotein
MRRLLKSFWVGLTIASALVALPAAAAEVRAADGFRETSEVMLQDGINAAIDGDATGARRILKQLIGLYPRSPAADEARSELAKLEAAATNSASDDSDDNGKAAGESKRPEQNDQARKARFRFVTEVGDRVFFAENSAVVGGRARAVLEAQGRWLKKASAVLVTIIGRADDGGTEAEAAALGLARAEAVKAKLIEVGVDASRLRIESRGRSDPVATCGSTLCQAQNRQAETHIGFPDLDSAKTGLNDAMPPDTRGADAALGQDSVAQ